MSGEDVRRAEASIEEIARELGGETPINDLILELKEAGIKNQGIADMLDVSIDTVKRPLRAARASKGQRP